MKIKNVLKSIITFLIAAVVGIYLVSAIVKLATNPTETFIVSNGTITQEETLIGYFIRDEVVIKGENYQNGMEQIVDEGQKVAKGKPIFRYYSSNEEELIQQIAEIDEKIQKAIEDNGQALYNSDIKLIDEQITERLKLINTYNSIQEIQEEKTALSDFAAKKANIAAEISTNDSDLKKLITQRKEINTQIAKNSEYVYAPSSGALSYRIDGLEEVLKTSDIANYNKEYLDKLNLKTGQIVPTSNEQGKIVNNFECYVVTTSNSDEAKNSKVGDKIKIIIPSGKTVDAKVANKIEESTGEVTIAIKFTDNIEEVLNYRKVSFDIIWWDETGYKIPNSAIIIENNLNYVIRSRQGHLRKVLVKVKKQTNTYSIVKNYSATELKGLNADEKAVTSISLNDEIVLNPTEEQIEEAGNV